MALKRLWFRDVLLNQRTIDMILGAEKVLGWQLVPTQGSYNKGGVAASAGTHDGGGAVDFRARTLTASQIAVAVAALREVGFAAWHRLPTEGKWVEHIHCIAIGDLELSRGAADQVTAYKNDKNGLANNHADNATREYVDVTWETYQADLAKKVIHISIIRYGASGGYFHSGQQTALDEVRFFVRWCNRLGVASDKDIRVWETFIRQANWKSAGLQLTGIIRALQRRYGKPVDGVFGPVTADILAHDGYRIVA